MKRQPQCDTSKGNWIIFHIVLLDFIERPGDVAITTTVHAVRLSLLRGSTGAENWPGYQETWCPLPTVPGANGVPLSLRGNLRDLTCELGSPSQRRSVWLLGVLANLCAHCFVLHGPSWAGSLLICSRTKLPPHTIWLTVNSTYPPLNSWGHRHSVENNGL